MGWHTLCGIRPRSSETALGSAVATEGFRQPSGSKERGCLGTGLGGWARYRIRGNVHGEGRSMASGWTVWQRGWAITLDPHGHVHSVQNAIDGGVSICL